MSDLFVLSIIGKKWKAKERSILRSLDNMRMFAWMRVVTVWPVFLSNLANIIDNSQMLCINKPHSYWSRYCGTPQHWCFESDFVLQMMPMSTKSEKRLNNLWSISMIRAFLWNQKTNWLTKTRLHSFVQNFLHMKKVENVSGVFIYSQEFWCCFGHQSRNVQQEYVWLRFFCFGVEFKIFQKTTRRVWTHSKSSIAM